MRRSTEEDPTQLLSEDECPVVRPEECALLEIDDTIDTERKFHDKPLFTRSILLPLVPILLNSVMIGYISSFTFFMPHPINTTVSGNKIKMVNESVLQVGGLIGTLVMFAFYQFFGFRKGLILASILCLISTSLILLGVSAEVKGVEAPSLVSGSLIGGVGVGLSFALLPTLLSDISPLVYRGSLVYTHSLFYLLGYSFPMIDTNSNLSKYFISAITWGIAIIQVCFLRYLPESPVWLVETGQISRAKEQLMRLWPEYYSFSDTSLLRKELQELEDLKKIERLSGSWKDLLLRSKLVLVGLCLTTMLVLLNFVTVTNSTYQKSNYVNVPLSIISLVLSLFLSDRLGRRPLLLASSSILAVSIIFLSIWQLAFHSDKQVPDAKECLTAIASGPGFVVWPLLCEIFPLRMRRYGLTFTLIVMWGVGLLFMILVDSFNKNELYFGVGTEHFGYWLVPIIPLCIVSLITYLLTPETKRLTLLDIQCKFFPKLRLSYEWEKERETKSANILDPSD